VQPVEGNEGVRGELFALPQDEEYVSFLSHPHVFDLFKLTQVLFLGGVAEILRIHLFMWGYHSSCLCRALVLAQREWLVTKKKGMSTADTAEAELLGDFRPGYTLWKKTLPTFTAIIIQGEGGDLISQDLEDGVVIMKRVMRESKRYVTFYDLTEGIGNLLVQAPALLKFAAEVRKDARAQQLCTVAVCNNEQVRNWVRWILGVASKGIPYHIARTSSDAWQYLESGQSVSDSDAFGETAALPQTLTLTAADTATDPTAILPAPSLLRLL